MARRPVFGLAAMPALLIPWTALSLGVPASRADADGFVTASSIHSDPYLPEYAVDGNAQTRWASRGFAGKPEWLQIDLGKVVPVEGLVVHWERAHAVAYQIQVSTDGRDWQTVHDRQDARGGREVVPGLSARGRYVRVQCLEPGQFGLFSIWEVEFPDGEAATAVAEAKRRAADARRMAER